MHETNTPVVELPVELDRRKLLKLGISTVAASAFGGWAVSA